MNVRRLIRSLALAGIVAASAAGAASAQDVKCTKYQLPNGMTVILHEDHSLPTATVNIWYRVGSQDEPTGRTGFAHLFEHLMFMGTKRVPGSDFDNLMEGGGGANNASTDLHRTNYFSWGPAKLLPTLLWLDADRLEDMGLNMSQEKLDKQRAVVRNELRQTIENRPYGKAEEYVSRLLYPPDHPYHIGTAGLHADLEAATVENVRDFFANFYVPNNASLVVAGDFDAAQIRPLVDKLFGTLARGAEPPRRKAQPAKLDRVVRYSMIDKVQLPKIMFAYHSPRAYEDGDAEMSLVAQLLTNGKTSRLYKRLVYQDQLAVDVSAAQSSYPFGSVFRIDVQVKPDVDLDKIESIVDEEIAKLTRDGVTAAELDGQKAPIELATLAALQDLGHKADKLNEYEYYWGEPNSFKRDLDRYRNATPDAVRNWATKVLTPGARAIVRVYPEEPEREESPRDKRPAEAAQQTFAPPAPETFKLSNGLPVMLWRRAELPLISMTLAVRPGGALESPAQAGLAELTTQMLDEGAGDKDSLAFSQAMQELGAEFSASAEHETLNVSLTALKRNFERASALFADAIRRPRLDAKDWERVKTLHLEELKQQDEEPTIVSGRVAARLLYGDDHAYAWPVSGTPETVEKLTLNNIKSAHAALLTPASSALFIAGDVTVDEAKAMLEKSLGDWKPAAGVAARGATEIAPPKAAPMQVVIVDRPEAVQTVIRFAAPGFAYANPKRVPLELLSTILGGSFTSRLNQNLREAHGYTYGARSSFAMNISAGAFTASASVKTEVTGAALKEFLSEFKRIRAGDISDSEAGKARETVRNDTVSSFAGLHGLLAAGIEAWENKLPFETVAQDLAAGEKVTAAELNALAKPSIAIENAVLVLVGDRAKILEQIKDLDLPAPKFCDERGALAADEK